MWINQVWQHGCHILLAMATKFIHIIHRNKSGKKSYPEELSKNFFIQIQPYLSYMTINSQKILEMNRQGDNIIVFDSIKIKNKSTFLN